MEACCSDLEVDINGEETIFLNKQIICAYSGTLRKLLGKSTCSNGNLKVIFNDFPGGGESFELVSRFCYNNGRLAVMPSNVVFLHCAAKFMEVTKVLEQTEKCMEEIRYWAWPEVLLCLKQCQEVETSPVADSLAAKLMDALVEKLCLTIEMSPSSAASACSPDSSLFRFSCDSKSTESFTNSSLDQATLDNLLVTSPSKSSHLYYVNLVLRFTKAFLDGERGGLQLKKVSSLIDQYIAEVAPDPCLKPSKFLSLLTLVPDSARESHEEIYRAIDMYLEAHTGLTDGEKLNLIRTLSYEKLSGESRAHISRNTKFQAIETLDEQQQQPKQLILRMEKVEISGENEKLKEHIEGIQWRVMELERACLKMQNQMEVIKKKSKSSSKGSNRSLPKLCS
ncbi:LOW QUALITY PROTEIN: BTB/POZ domain-containing protein At3g22104 [Arabidopsis lyrata subsp. lyrata]|uniref:LOW QUALITY PROTEIN: BTB/POZ domain-containing protein At3g22104 n=1 Tax=Arabidopsis lyrata subsp. lyrata TaxID=81972 RepID=UPI000A29CC91|nr:LOW QUALITY PROTEIN: BTB/POZ domain-containing protein At3g22104 [Arabidopsis lyrata subsp. lyrata]|eukprot:XP_020886756.1 LOW QUALITY PROTEIN: BTB/POZ domain-containing protein At3g22104 [Arabidopsis lyrata subsp. lyrata]